MLSQFEFALKLKRAFDIVVAVVGLLALAPILFVAGVAIAVETRAWPIFKQKRVGRGGQLFEVKKFRTMWLAEPGTAVTTVNDPRITTLGRWLRAAKFDELPQLWHVLVGEMSLVGPRPDVPGYADHLAGGDRAVLALRPGITSWAALLLRDEEKMLAQVADSERFNNQILYPYKTKLNLQYVENRSFLGDIGIILRTLVPAMFQPALRARSHDVWKHLLALDCRQRGYSR